MTRKKLEKIYRFKSDPHAISRVVMIGCGGNGSMLAPHLARLVSTLDREVEVIFADGDIVEEKNLIRQHFVAGDIGKNKAEALATRYSRAFGITISHLPEYLTKKNVSGLLESWNEVLCITCTDNLTSRHLVHSTNDIGWIDLGNEQDAGQVVVSHTTNKKWGTSYICNETRFAMPTVFEIFPDYLEKVKSEVPIEERSCADFAEASPVQAGFVNNTAAAIAMNYVHAYMTGRPITNHITFFSIDNAYEHRTMTKSTIEKWVSEYERFKNVILD